MAATEPWVSNRVAQAMLRYTQFFSPPLLFIVFLVAFVVHSIKISPPPAKTPEVEALGPGGKPLPRNLSRRAKAKQQEAVKVDDFSPGRKAFFNVLFLFLALTFIVNAVLVIVHALADRKNNWWCGDSVVIYIVASFFIYALVLITLVENKPSPCWYHLWTWALMLATEVILMGATLALYTSKHREGKAGSPRGGKMEDHLTRWEAVEVLIGLVRIICLSAAIFLYGLFTLLGRSSSESCKTANGHTEETTGLLNGHGNGHGKPGQQTYGTSTKDAEEPPEQPGWVRQAHPPKKTWWEFVRAYSLFLPYLWPSKSRRLQMILGVCCILVAVNRVINILVPDQVGRITNMLSGEDGSPPGIPWLQILVFILLRFLQGQNGLVNQIRVYLWTPVSQYSYRELTVASFEHVHGLSLDFHLGKQTGEVMSALNKGASINTFLGLVTFEFFPMIIDLVVAIVYLLVRFDVYYALVVTLIAFIYVYITIRLASWRVGIRRNMTNLERAAEAVKNDSMISYETVKYFNAESYEFNRYREKLLKFQAVEFINQRTLSILNLAQTTCFLTGLMITCFIAAFQVATGRRLVGAFVTLLTLMAQLQGPLNFLGTFYKQIQSSMINAERLLELFKERPTVVDKPGVRDLDSCNGEITFDDVSFSYDPRKAALNGLDFTCTPGTTTALVGESGGGKSTVFRLLFRFYNIDNGNIKIDGQDLRDLTIDSVRRHIGVVPQDTVLFNESLMYNVRYARQSASDQEVYAACRAASIHDQILSFPDGYNTVVGERGLKLSGGEKQRIAIARTILKGPRIILLDEATASLDTETEQHIESGLRRLSEQRTTLVIAHRLSTITSADQIVVLHAGQVVEKGTHDHLLSLNGRYALMWRKQIRAQLAAQEARKATDRAKQLRHEAQGDESANQSEDERVDRQDHSRTPSDHLMSGALDDDVSGPSLSHEHP